MYTAIAIAISASVTVSIGDETSGAFNVISLDNREHNITSSAEKSIYPGKIIKSLQKNCKYSVLF